MSFNPDEQLNDWYGWMTTQAGHSALVGMPAAFVLYPLWGPYIAPPAIALVYFIVWEWIIQDFGAGIGDALADSACVMSGAAVICGAFVGFWTAVWAFAAWSAFIACGVYRRA